MSLNSRLETFAKNKGDVPVAIVGAGYVARGVLHTLTYTPAVSPKIIVNRSVDRALEALSDLGIRRDQITVSDDVSELEQAIRSGHFAVTQEHKVLASLPVDIVIEATGALDYGTHVILDALEAGKHVVSFNAEVDSLLAYRFHRAADEHGVVYTIADGDQPGALFRLAEQVEAMGFDVRALINCKRHLNLHQDPGTGAAYSARDTTSAKMTTAFGDGTKMQVEQAVVANATGMAPVKRGMNGIKTTVENLTQDIVGLWPENMPHQRHVPESQTKNGVVDYTLGGDFAAGVGIVARHPQGEHHSKAMSLYKMGDGPDYFFFRPYHLVHLELPLTMADIILHREALARVDLPHVATVVAMAKKDLVEGEALDGIGGFCAYGLIDSYEAAVDFLPMALGEYATLTRPVAQDEPIPLNAVQFDESKRVVREWRSLSALWAENLQAKEA